MDAEQAYRMAMEVLATDACDSQTKAAANELIRSVFTFTAYRLNPVITIS